MDLQRKAVTPIQTESETLLWGERHLGWAFEDDLDRPGHEAACLMDRTA